LELFGDFVFTIEHIPGRKNRADCPSRRPDLMACAAVALDSQELISELQEA